MTIAEKVRLLINCDLDLVPRVVIREIVGRVGQSIEIVRRINQVLGNLRNKISVIDCSAAGGFGYIGHRQVFRPRSAPHMPGVEETASVDRIDGDSARFELGHSWGADHCSRSVWWGLA